MFIRLKGVIERDSAIPQKLFLHCATSGYGYCQCSVQVKMFIKCVVFISIAKLRLYYYFMSLDKS